MDGERAGTRAAGRFRALDAIAVRAQAVRDPTALFPAVGTPLEELGFHCYVYEWDAAAGEVVLRYASLPAPLRRAAALTLGRRIEGLRIPATRVPSLATALDSGRTVYLPSPEDDFAAAIPWVSRTAARHLLRLLRVERAIVAPLLASGVALGVLAVHGADLSEDDVPFMASLGTHVGEAFAAVRVLEAAQRREAAALALGKLSTQVATGTAAVELPALAVRTLRGPLGAAAAAVWLLDRTGREPLLRLTAQEGVPEHSIATIVAIPLGAERLAARVAREGRTLALWNRKTEAWSDQRETHESLRLGGFGLAITAPLRASGRILGVLSLTFMQARPASADEQSFVEAVAAQVAAALENARLLAETRAQAARAALLAGLAALLGSSLDPATLLTSLAERTAEALQGCAAVYLTRDDGDDGDGGTGFAVAGVHHPDPARMAAIRRGLAAIPPRPGVGVFGQAYAERRPLLARFDDPALSAEQRVYAERVGATSTMAVPLLAHGRLLGVLAISSVGDDRPYEPDDLTLATAIGSLAAQALDNARAYADAEEGRRRLAATFDSMVDAVILYDADGRVIDLNEAGLRLLGHPPRGEAMRPVTAFLGRFIELRYPDGRPIDAQNLPSRRAIGGETVVGFEEIVRILSTSEEMQAILNAAPLRDESGHVTGAVLVAHDVTELRAAERARAEFLSVASHELKTPLTPLKGFVQIMSDMVERADQGAPLDHARLRRYLHTVNGRVDSLIGLVGTMLDLSRLQAGSFALNLAPTDLVPLATEVLASFDHEGAVPEHARHYLVLDAPAPVVARCDPQRLDQVLTNLVANAIKYSPSGGEVVMRVRCDGDLAIVTVEDEGIGIPPGEAALLYQPFVRGSNAPALQYAGVGLGLYICREIVERHGGSISAAPRDPAGQRPGTTFRVALPLAGPPAAING